MSKFSRLRGASSGGALGDDGAPAVAGTTGLLGGSASPVGWWSVWLEAPLDQVQQALTMWRQRLGQTIDVTVNLPLRQGLGALEPLESPWTTELLAPGGAWTLYLNNDRGGGDPTGAPSFLSRELDARLVCAMHTPVHPPGHGGTQLWVGGPTGSQPSRSIRTVSAVCEDSRWRWLSTGEMQPFEQPDRYLAHRIRDRLDRQLLVDYLSTVGIEPDDADAYGLAVLVRQRVSWPTVKETRAQALTRLTAGSC